MGFYAGVGTYIDMYIYCMCALRLYLHGDDTGLGLKV